MARFGYTDEDRERWADALGGAIAAAAAKVRARAETSIAGVSPNVPPVHDLFRPEWWTEALDDEVGSLAEELADEAADGFEEGTGTRLDSGRRSEVVAAVVAGTLGLLASRATTVRDRYTEVHGQALGGRWTDEQVSAALGLDGTGGPLSDLTARAMGISAATYLAQGTAYKLAAESGQEIRRVWRCTFVPLSREDHMDADGQTVGMDEPFKLGEYEAMYPGDETLPVEQTVNCLCTVDYEVVERAQEEEDQGPEFEMEIEPIAASAATSVETMSAGPDYSDGVMVCLRPDDETARRLAINGGVPMDELHLTLGYFGSADEMSPDDEESIPALVRSLEGAGHMEGTVAAVTEFDGDPAPLVAIIDVPGQLLETIAAKVRYDEAAKTDHGFTPHITLGYDMPDGTGEYLVGQPVRFDRGELVWGESVHARFNVTGGDSMAVVTTKLPLASGDPSWDGDAAHGRVVEWASSDGSGDPSTVDFDRFKKAFLWYDEEAPDNITSYKFLIGDIVNGDLKAIPKGIQTAANVLQGGRGGTKLPEADQEQMRGALNKYYDQMDMTPPWQASAGASFAIPQGIRLVEGSRLSTPGGLSLTLDRAGTWSPVESFTEVPDLTGMEWSGPLVVEGTYAGDGRYIREGALTWRDLPWSLLAMFVLPEPGTGHMGAEVAGSTKIVWRDGSTIMGAGTFARDPDDPTKLSVAARRLRQHVRDGDMRGMSVTFDKVVIDDVAYATSGRFEVVSARIMTVTALPEPAFQEAGLQLLADEGTALVASAIPFGEWKSFDEEAQAMVASAALAEALDVPVKPPVEWFAYPDTNLPGGLVDFIADESGRCYGHVVDWKARHIGYLNKEVHAPRTRTGYEFYYGPGHVDCADGTRIETGPIYVSGGHADDLSLDFASAQRAMADTCTALCDVHLFEDQFGIWASGALRPGVTPAMLRAAMASQISPDYRPVGRRHLELAGLVFVNTGGLKRVTPRVRWSYAADDEAEVLAMVAVGMPGVEEVEEVVDSSDTVSVDEFAALGANVVRMSDTVSEALALVTGRVKGLEQFVVEGRRRSAMATFGPSTDDRRRAAYAALGVDDPGALADEASGSGDVDPGVAAAVVRAISGDGDVPVEIGEMPVTLGPGTSPGSVAVKVGRFDAGQAELDGSYVDEKGNKGTAANLVEAVVALVGPTPAEDDGSDEADVEGGGEGEPIDVLPMEPAFTKAGSGS